MTSALDLMVVAVVPYAAALLCVAATILAWNAAPLRSRSAAPAGKARRASLLGISER